MSEVEYRASVDGPDLELLFELGTKTDEELRAERVELERQIAELEVRRDGISSVLVARQHQYRYDVEPEAPPTT